MRPDASLAQHVTHRLRPTAALDVGTVWTRMIAPGQPLIEERSLVAVNRTTGEVVAWGNRARDQLSRNGAAVQLDYPVQSGGVASLTGYAFLLQDLVRRARGRGLRSVLFGPRILLAVPPATSPFERAAITAVGRHVGCTHLELIESSRAAAAGAGIDPGAIAGNMLVEVGGGVMAATVFSRGEVVVRQVARIGAERIDTALMEHFRKTHRVRVGRETARLTKERHGHERDWFTVRCMDIATGLPRSVEAEGSLIHDATRAMVDQLCDLVGAVLAQTPPDLAGDLLTNGLAVVGGLARMGAVTRALERYTGCPVRVPDEPERCVLRGLTILGRMVRSPGPAANVTHQSTPADNEAH